MRYDCAPLEGVTGWIYRNVHHRHFPEVDRYYMPFLSPTQDHCMNRKERQDILPEHNRGFCAVPQVLTRRAEDFLWAAEVMADMGYGEVNLNLGCPSGTVVAKGKGSGFLADPYGLDRFLEEVFSRARVKISIKTRLGVREAEEFQELLEVYARYPVEELIVHPRVQKDFYKNRVRPEYVARALADLPCPVCYNGDLTTAADCAEVERRFPTARAIMLGRGLIADPALIRKAKGGVAADRDSLRAFHDELYERYAEEFQSRRNAMLRMKEVWSFMGHLFGGGERHVKNLRKARDTGEFEVAVAAIFRELPLLEDAVGLRDYMLFEP